MIPALILHFDVQPQLGRVAVEGLGIVVGEAPSDVATSGPEA